MLGFYRPSPSPVDLKICEILDSVLNFYGPAIRSGKIIVEKRYDSEDVIHGFPSEITQVFSNLVGNALGALTPEGTLELHVIASRDWGNPARRGVRVFIADNGPGISAENRREFLSHSSPQKVRMVLVLACGSQVGLSISMEAGFGCAAARSPGEAGPVSPSFSRSRRYRQCIILISG